MLRNPRKAIPVRELLNLRAPELKASPFQELQRVGPHVHLRRDRAAVRAGGPGPAGEHGPPPGRQDRPAAAQHTRVRRRGAREPARRPRRHLCQPALHRPGAHAPVPELPGALHRHRAAAPRDRPGGCPLPRKLRLHHQHRRQARR